MAKRKNDSPEKAAIREMMQAYLKENDVSIKSGEDVNSIMRNMMSVLLEGALDEELGYSKYDYRNKETDNSRNGHSSRTMHTSYGDMEIEIPRDHKGEFEPQLIKKYQNTVTQDMEEKIISMYAKGMTTGDIEDNPYLKVTERSVRPSMRVFPIRTIIEIRKKLRGIKRIRSIRNTTPLDNVEGGEDVMHLEFREGYRILKETEEGIDSLVFSKE